MAVFDKGHALIIGVGNYLDPNWKAPHTATEAEAVYVALRDEAVAAYPKAQVTLLTHAQATLAGITTALKNLTQQVQPDSTVLIYLAGHGALDTTGEYCFATQDTVFIATNQIQAGTGLRQSDLLTWLKQMQPQKLLILINACFSGNVQAGVGALGGVPPVAGVLGTAPSYQTIELLAGGEGRALITASRSNQQSSYYTAQPYTFFGQAVIDGLRGNGLAGAGGYVGLFEFYTFIHARVKQATAALGRVQDPVITLAQGVGGFPIALH